MYFEFNFFLINFLVFNLCNCLSPHPLTLIISFDAFRHDYVDKGFTPTLKKLRDEGCSAEYLQNVFITKTFTNHASICSGLFPEVHGVMGNSFYDPKNGLLHYGYEMWHFSDKFIPLWIANERKGDGRYSGVMMWPGNEYNYTGIRPTFHQAFTDQLPLRQRVDTALSWFTHPVTPANLVMMYLEEPDSHGHAFGPESAQTIETIRTMDDIAAYLLERLNKADLKSRMNIFFVSDHGMETVTKKNVIDLRKYVDDSLYDRFESSPTLHVHPKKGKGKLVHEGLLRGAQETGAYKVLLSSEMPKEYRYSNERTPPILLLANPPNVFHDFYETAKFFEDKYNFTANDDSPFGVHGYVNTLPSMRPYFIAIGPAIRNRKRVPPFRTVDLFSIWAELLGFPEVAATTHGSAVPARLVLKPRKHLPVASIVAGIVGSAMVLAAMAITVYFLHRKLRHKYQRLSQCDLLEDGSKQKLLDSEEEA